MNSSKSSSISNNKNEQTCLAAKIFTPENPLLEINPWLCGAIPIGFIYSLSSFPFHSLFIFWEVLFSLISIVNLNESPHISHILFCGSGIRPHLYDSDSPTTPICLKHYYYEFIMHSNLIVYKNLWKIRQIIILN